MIKNFMYLIMFGTLHHKLIIRVGLVSRPFEGRRKDTMHMHKVYSIV